MFVQKQHAHTDTLTKQCGRKHPGSGCYPVTEDEEKGKEGAPAAIATAGHPHAPNLSSHRASRPPPQPTLTPTNPSTLAAWAGGTWGERTGRNRDTSDGMVARTGKKETVAL